jgi:hypothetical protein
VRTQLFALISIPQTELSKAEKLKKQNEKSPSQGLLSRNCQKYNVRKAPLLIYPEISNYR